MKLSVVIPCHNAAETLGEQLDALSHQQWGQPWEVVIVDNNCTDPSMDIARQYNHQISNLRIVQADEKAGAGYARNVGVQNSRSECIAFCDADDVMGEHWVPSVGEALKTHNFIACSMEWEKLNQLSNIILKAKKQKDRLMEFSLIPFLPHAGGGTLAIKKSLHDKVGGFDETLEYLEDTDYCWRVQLSGEKLVFCRDAIIHIRERVKGMDRFKQQMNWAEYNILLYERYRDMGLGAYPNKRILRSFYKITKSVPRQLFRSNRDNYFLRSAAIIGHLKGMIKFRLLHIRDDFVNRPVNVGQVSEMLADINSKEVQ